MGTLAEPIFERDKKRVGGIVLTMPTIERRGRRRKGEARIDAICGVAPPRRSYHYAFVVAFATKPWRTHPEGFVAGLASGIYPGFQCAH